MSGWIKLHRNLIDWEWYDDHNTTRLFIHCVIKANFEPKNWRGISIERGQFWSSIPSLCAETGLSTSQIRTSLNKLKLTGELTVKSQAQGRMITIVEYNLYQADDRQDDRPVTDEPQTSDRPVTATKNDKNDKNDKNCISPDGSHALKDDWIPNKILWEGKAFQAGLVNKDYQPYLTEFICHYQGQAAKPESYWVGKLISWIKRAPAAKETGAYQHTPLNEQELEEINNG